MTLSLSSSAFVADPYPTYARLRHHEPVAIVQQPLTGTSYMLTRYDDVVAALKDPRLSTDARRVPNAMSWMDSPLLPGVFRAMRSGMLQVDDPEHRRLRDLVHKGFTPRMVETLAPRIERITHDLLDSAARRPNFVELIEDFAMPLPLTVISEMLGIPQGDRLRFRKWSQSMLEVSSLGALQMFTFIPAMYQMLAYFKRLIAERRAQPEDDLISALVRAEQDDDRLTEDEIISTIFLLMLAGHETTVNLIASGTLALLEHPDQLACLRENPALMDSAVEELVRYTNPVEQASPRFALEDIDMHGKRIPKGSIVWLALAGANRDETVFLNPDQLDITRTPNKHLAFGMGIHYCLGAPLARMEGAIALRALIERFPRLRLAVPAAQLEWRNAVAVRGLKALPLFLN
jgi:cytochrome P450